MASSAPGPLECVPEFLRLVSRPMWSPTMADVMNQEDWTDFVSRWIAIGVALGVVFTVASYGVVLLVMILTIVGIFGVPFVLIGLFTRIAAILFRSFLGWYCIVKRPFMDGPLHPLMQIAKVVLWLILGWYVLTRRSLAEKLHPWLGIVKVLFWGLLGWFFLAQRRNVCGCGNSRYLLFALCYIASPALQMMAHMEPKSEHLDEREYMDTIGLMIGLAMAIPDFAVAYGCIRLFVSEPEVRSVAALSGGVHPSSPAAQAPPGVWPAQALAPPAAAATAPAAQPMQAMAHAREMVPPATAPTAPTPGQQV